MATSVRTAWRRWSLGDVVTLHRGYDLPERDRRPGNVPVVSSSGVTGYHDIARREGPGVVTGRYGTLGEVFYVAEDYWPLNTTLFVSDFKGNDPRFISYFLRTLNFGQQNAAGAVPGVNRNHLHLLPVALPPLPTQRKIAAILSAYDDLIERNTRRIALLEQMARALYREWFVEFRYPGHTGAPLVESPLGSIPQGWRVAKLGEAVELAYGKALTAQERREGSIPVYGSSGIVGYHDTPLVNGPGIIVGRKGNVGSVYWSDEGFHPIDTVYFVRSELPMPYLYFNLLGQRFIDNDAAVPGLNRNQAYSLPLLIPTSEVLRPFLDFIVLIFGNYSGGLALIG